ncbi:V8-like Glu-specific endopeptidase [Streptomyces sp. V4I8]|uniref:hypothetical protein n=1 Tax=Streptomyces sp. V4I8 TaxID=3156469 RepID=UPI003512C2EC
MTDVRVAAVCCAGREGAEPSFGSGYAIANRLVLTAAHVVRAAGGTRGAVQVRIGEQVCSGTVAWIAEGISTTAER